MSRDCQIIELSTDISARIRGKGGVGSEDIPDNDKLAGTTVAGPNPSSGEKAEESDVQVIFLPVTGKIKTIGI